MDASVHIAGHAQPIAPLLDLDLAIPLALLVMAAAMQRTPAVRRRGDVILLLVAATALTAVAVGPFHQAAGRSVTGHMAQHLLILVVAAPCIGVVLSRAPSRLRGRPPIRHVAAIAVGSSITPLIAGTAHLTALVIWHLPGPYDAALDHWFIHGIEHLAMLGTGVWWWATVSHHAARKAVGSAVVSLFGVATGGAALGIFMMFAPSPLYAHGGVGDQQIAGALMSGGMGFVFGGTAMYLTSRALERMSAPQPGRVPLRGSAGSRGASTLAVVAACGLGTVIGLAVLPPRPTGAVVAVPASAQQPVSEDLGRDLYRRDCASCHGPEGGGSFRGTPLTEVGTASVSYVLTTGRMPIATPADPVVRSDPAYQPDEIQAIVTYLAGIIEGPSVPELDLEAADVARGGVHYRLHCAACHSAEGIGGALAFRGFAPSVLQSDPIEVANVMVSGPGAMPAFAATFDEADMADIAAYIAWIQDPPTRGVPLPGGRVTEGLVAWLVGIGILILGARWIGTTS